jgi:hypothetical protein
MKLFRPLNFILIAAFILTACSSNGGVSIFPTETSLPQPVVTINSAPDAGAALTAYLDAYKADDYNAMYAMLSKVTTDALPLDQFAKRNKDALNEMSAGSFDYVINSALVNPLSAEVAYNVTYHTVLAGDIQRDMIARFTLEDGKWKLQWDDANILPGTRRRKPLENGLQNPLARRDLRPQRRTVSRRSLTCTRSTSSPAV